MKKRTKNKNFVLITFKGISKGLNPSQIAKKENVNLSTISYHARKLSRLGFIEKLSNGVWVTQKKPYRVAKPKPYKIIRSHGFVFTLKLPNITNWNNRETYLKLKNIYYKNLKNNTQSILIKGNKVWLSNNSITIYFKKYKQYLTGSSQEGRNKAILDFLSLIKHIESKFKISLKINKNYVFSVSRQHHAYIKNTLAKIYNNPKKRFELYKNRKLWLLIDNSFNLNELETVDPELAHKDMDKAIKPFFNSMRDAPFTAYDFHNLTNSVDKIAESNHLWASHINSHTKAIIKLSKLIEQLGEQLNGGNKES